MTLKRKKAKLQGLVGRDPVNNSLDQPTQLTPPNIVSRWVSGWHLITGSDNLTPLGQRTTTLVLTQQLFSGWKIFSFWTRPVHVFSSLIQAQLLWCFLRCRSRGAVAGSRRSNKHPNRGELGDPIPQRRLSVEINVSGGEDASTQSERIGRQQWPVCGVEQI